MRSSGQDELQPEGNGTGFLWDDSGNVVTNYHVLQSALAAMGRRPGAQRSAQNRPVVAKITLLGLLHERPSTLADPAYHRICQAH